MPRPAWGLTLALTLWASRSIADEPEPISWHPEWRRFRRAEAVATGVLTLQAATALLLYPVPERTWTGLNSFDEAVRDVARLHSRDARDQLRIQADVLYYTLAVFPFVVDTAIVTWGVHGSGDVALQMLAMNAESYALTGALSLTAQKLGRARPSTRGCSDDPSYSPKCDNPRALSESFFSGHTAVAFTSAGLTCAHHQHLPLYGSRAGDFAACLAGLAGATAEGVSRVMTDDHYASDILVGAAVGLLSGYVMPVWLHYGVKSPEGERAGGFWMFRSRAGGAPFAALLAPVLALDYAGPSFTGAY